MFTFVETKLFTQLVGRYLSDDEYSALQQSLMANPDAGSMIRGSGGVRTAVGYRRSREARWDPGCLLHALATGSDLDADAVREERGREHSGHTLKRIKEELDAKG